MTELEAARLVRAGLDLLINAVPDVHKAIILDLLATRNGCASLNVEAMEADAPPWSHEPAPAKPIPWSQVSPGDEVQAPNGTWYRVDAWARIGGQVKVLLIGPDGAKIPSNPKAADAVPTRRGATGQAADIFRAGGLDVEQIKVEVAA